MKMIDSCSPIQPRACNVSVLCLFFLFKRHSYFDDGLIKTAPVWTHSPIDLLR